MIRPLGLIAIIARGSRRSRTLDCPRDIPPCAAVHPDVDIAETGRGLVAYGCAAAVPDIGRQVMVVAIRSVESGAGVAARDTEPENAGIECFRRRDGTDLKMDVADNGTCGEAPPLPFARVINQTRDIKHFSSHLDQPVLPSPLGGGPVGVDFDAIAFWIGKIERFADAMIRRADHRDARRRGMTGPGSEIGSAWKQERSMEQAGFARRAAASRRVAAQFHKRDLADTKCDPIWVGQEATQSDRLLVEAGDPIQIVDGQGDAPHGKRRGFYGGRLDRHGGGFLAAVLYCAVLGVDRLSARAPSPASAREIRPEIQSPRNSQPPLGLVKKKPAGP